MAARELSEFREVSPLDGVSGRHDGRLLCLPEYLAQINHGHHTRLNGGGKHSSRADRRKLIHVTCKRPSLSME